MAVRFALASQWRGDNSIIALGDYCVEVPDGSPIQSGVYRYKVGTGIGTFRTLSYANAAAYFAYTPTAPALTDVRIVSPALSLETTQQLVLGKLSLFQFDGSGNLKTTGGGGGGGGVVDQGTGGLSPWLVTGPLTDAQLRAAPVPISASALPLPTGAATEVTLASALTALNSILAKLNATLAVTQSGTWTVQPGNTANTTPWRVDASGSIQPVSGTVAVSNFPASYPVTGTFWQAVQPVSGPLTDAQLRASAVPVSLAAAPLPTDAATLTEQQLQTAQLVAIRTLLDTIDDWDESDRAKVNPIVGQAGVQAGSGNVTANTQRVVIATDQPAFTNPMPVNVSQVAGAAIATGSGTAAGAIRVELPSNGSGQVNILPPTLTKGTQGSTGLSTQPLEDGGRTTISLYTDGSQAPVSSGTEALITLTLSSGTAATSAGTSFIIPNGKTFRILQIIFESRGNTTATAQTTQWSLRMNTAGAINTSSTPVLLRTRTTNGAVANGVDRQVFTFPKGFDIVGDGTLQFGVSAQSTYTTNAPTWYVNIIGFYF